MSIRFILGYVVRRLVIIIIIISELLLSHMSLKAPPALNSKEVVI